MQPFIPRLTFSIRCDGQEVNPWVVDITNELKPTGNTVQYFGYYNGKDPDPTSNPGMIGKHSTAQNNFFLH